MTTPQGCSAWAEVDDLPDLVSALHPAEVWCSYLALATDVLWSATGRRWRGSGGTAEAVIGEDPPGLGQPVESGESPLPRACQCSAADLMRSPWSRRGGHREPVRVRLPHPDVTAVTAVTVADGVFVPWRLDGAWLTRTDGRGWPVCGGTAVVAYEYGIDPPAGGKLAVVELASELGIAAAPDCDLECRLPQRVTSVNRQGLSFDLLDPQDFLDQGKTGIYSIDLWLTSVNPRRRPEAGRVWSPEISRARRRA